MSCAAAKICLAILIISGGVCHADAGKQVENRPDIIVDYINISPDNPEIDGTVTATVKFRNQGEADSPAFKAGVNMNKGEWSEREVGPLGKNSQKVLKWTYRITQPGKNTFCAAADMDNAVDEANERNNETIASVLVPGKPDLLLQVKDLPDNPGVTVSGITPGGGCEHHVEKVSYVWTSVYNRGNAEARDVELGISKDGSSFDVISIALVKPGERKDIKVAWRPQEAGEHEFVIEADLNDNIPELDESNNMIALKADVRGADYDWGITGVQYQPAQVGRNDKVRFLVEVANKGNVSPRVSLDLYVDGVKVKRVSVVIPPGQKKVFGDGEPAGDDLVWQAVPGRHTVIAVLDTDRYRDNNGSDNVLTESINID